MPKYSAQINRPGYYGNNIPVVVETDTRWNAEALLKAQYPEHEIRFIEEVTPEPQQVDEISRQHDDSAGTDSRGGCLGVTLGIVCIAGFLIYNALFSDSAQSAKKPSAEPVSSIVSPVQVAPASTRSSESTDALQAASAEPAAQAPTTGDVDGAFPFPARIVDRRDEIVLQSGPGITSRNIAKLATGTVVQADSTEGKWIRVKTDDGLIGFVRRKQLDFAQAQ